MFYGCFIKMVDLNLKTCSIKLQFWRKKLHLFKGSDHSNCFITCKNYVRVATWKSPAARLIAQQLVWFNKKKNLLFWPVVMGICNWSVDSPHKGPVIWKVFHVMMSSWKSRCQIPFSSNQPTSYLLLHQAISINRAKHIQFQLCLSEPWLLKWHRPSDHYESLLLNLCMTRIQAMICGSPEENKFEAAQILNCQKWSDKVT